MTYCLFIETDKAMQRLRRSSCSALWVGLLSLLLWCLGGAKARAEVLEGVIMTADSLPLPYATVYLPACSMGTIADGAGIFKVDSLPAGTYAVEYASMGYATRHDTLTLASGQTLHCEVYLAERTITLPTLIVTVDGENPALSIMSRMLDSAEVYYQHIASYDASVVSRYEQDIKDLPRRARVLMKTATFAIPSMRRWVKFFLDHPDFRSRISYTEHYREQESTRADFRLLECNYTLTDEEQELFDPITEGGHPVIAAFIPSRKSIRNFKKNRYELVGIYDEDGYTIDVISYTTMMGDVPLTGKFHVVEDLWCLREADFALPSGSVKVVFREVAPHYFLPVSMLLKVGLLPGMPDGGEEPMLPGLNLLIGRSIRYDHVQVE